MRTTERLRGLQTWVEEKLCRGRTMKSPDPDMDVAKTTMREPKCYLAWFPTRPEAGALNFDDANNVFPSILIMPTASYAKAMEEQRFDRYNHITRNPDMGQFLEVDMLFSVYEPGNRLPGFVDSCEAGSPDINLLTEGTRDGLFTLLNWLDDAKEALIGAKAIPKTDLFLYDSSIVYSLYGEQKYISDKRPLFYGFIKVKFGCYADDGGKTAIDALLD